ncbi:MAG: DUF4082 domain-containing protein [Candidatus Margulisiibacteriota bacterium]
MRFAALILFCFSLSATAAQVKLTWIASPSPDVAGYDLYYGTAPDALVALVDAGNTLSYTINDVQEGVRYYYALKAYNADRTVVSPFSNIVSTYAFPANTSSAFNIDAPPNIATDAVSVELGMKFKPIVDGKILAIKMYVPPNIVGDRKVSLWDGAGNLLATATLADDGFTGAWVSIPFATPVDVLANNTYVASYWSPSGIYGYSLNAFAASYISGYLYLPSYTEASGNGVFRYSFNSTFPADSDTPSSYFVDVVFQKNVPTTSTFVYPSGLVFAYEFEGNLSDTASLNHCIANTTYSPSFVAGLIGQAAHLDGNDIITCPWAGGNDFAGSFSMGAWINPDEPMTNAKTIIAKVVGVNNNSWALHARNSFYNAPSELTLLADDTNNAVNCNPATMPICHEAFPNEWMHLFMTHDKVSGTDSLYINGVLASSNTRYAGNATKQSWGSLLIGANMPSAERFKGKIDSVQGYNRSLTATEINDIYMQH